MYTVIYLYVDCERILKLYVYRQEELIVTLWHLPRAINEKKCTTSRLTELNLAEDRQSSPWYQRRLSGLTAGRAFLFWWWWILCHCLLQLLPTYCGRSPETLEQSRHVLCYVTLIIHTFSPNTQNEGNQHVTEKLDHLKVSPSKVSEDRFKDSRSEWVGLNVLRIIIRTLIHIPSSYGSL